MSSMMISSFIILLDGNSRTVFTEGSGIDWLTVGATLRIGRDKVWCLIVDI
jgi:hypothetical protein